jgi:hypothetical protein
MNIVSLLVAGMLGLMAAVFAVWLFIAIIFNLRVGIRYRKSLVEEFERLRLSRMLEALGVDVNHYLHEEAIIDIHNHMKRCGACENIAECDDRLDSGDLAADDIAFCNNEKSLQTLVRRTQS